MESSDSSRRELERVRRASLQWIAGCVLIQLSIAVAVTATIEDEYDIGRFRNALIAKESTLAALDWTPDAIPGDFLVETVGAPQVIESMTRQLLAGDDDTSSFDSALKLARHLNSGPGSGGGIQSTTLAAYRGIVDEGRGYCADYTQVLIGMGHAAGLDIREWGMSFGEFSGDGHAFSEVFDESLGKWVFLDSFYSFYVVDADTGVPLSVREFRGRLLEANQDSVSIVPIVPERFGFKHVDAAFDYYRRGFPQLFLMNGVNVYTIDTNALTSAMGSLSRSLEQASAILLGLQPSAKIIVTSDNKAAVESLMRLKWLLVAAVFAVVVLGLLEVGFALRFALTYRGRR